MNQSRPWRSSGARVALFVAAVYLAGAPNGVMTDASAEFQTLCVTLGKTHPPGYPLLLCVGKCFAALPIGEIAFRLALLSVFFGVATVWLFFGLVQSLTGSMWAAFVAALALAFSHTFWMQAQLPEAYALNAFFIAVLLRLMLAAEQVAPPPSPAKPRASLWPLGRLWAVAALVVGLAFGNHQTIILFVPIGAAWFLWLAWRNVGQASRLSSDGIAGFTGLAAGQQSSESCHPVKETSHDRRDACPTSEDRRDACPTFSHGREARATLLAGLGIAAFAGAVGGAICLFMLLRFLAIGETAGGALYWARGGPSRELLFVYPPAEVARRLVDFLKYLAYQFPGTGALLALIGVASAWRSRRPWLLALAALAGGAVFYGLNFNSSDVYVLYVPAYLVAAVFVGVGFDASWRWTAGKWWTARMAIVALTLGAVATPPLVYLAAFGAAEASRKVFSQDKGNRYYLWPPKRSAVWMGDSVRALLEAAPPRAALVTDWNYFYTARYFQEIERLRRDVSVLNRVKDERGPAGWSAAVDDWFVRRNTPVVLTGADQPLLEKRRVWPFGAGVCVTPDGRAPAPPHEGALRPLDAEPDNPVRAFAVGQSPIARRGHAQWFVFQFDPAAPGFPRALSLHFGRIDRRFVFFFARRPLHDAAGRSSAMLLPVNWPALMGATEFAWPQAVPRYLDYGGYLPTGRYVGRTVLGRGAPGADLGQIDNSQTPWFVVK